MKKITLQTLLLTSALVLTTTAAQAWDFSYGYQNVFSPNAMTYVVGQQNVSRFSEWQTPPITYWGVSGNGVQGILTSRFDFAAPTAEIHLNCNLLAANWTGGQGVGLGAASLWASKDGAAWQLLLNEPTPPNGTFGTFVNYNQDVPSSLYGATSFWLQVRLQESGTASGYANAQFGRTDSSLPGNVFQLDAMVVPEPTTLGLGIAGALFIICGRARRQRP